MFNKVFLTDLAERAVSTALQAWAAAFAVPGPDVLDSVKVGLVAGLGLDLAACACTCISEVGACEQHGSPFIVDSVSIVICTVGRVLNLCPDGVMKDAVERSEERLNF